MPLKYAMPIMLVPMLSLIMIIMIDKVISVSNGAGDKLILPLVIMLMYVNFIMFDYMESYSNKLQLEAANEIIRKDRENYKILEENEKEIREIKHDIRKHMQVIANMNKSKNKDDLNLEISQYIDDLQNVVDNMTSVSYTGNEVLDSILNIKARRARIFNIRYFVKTNIEEEILIREMDLSTILCNALDNAIEGAVGTEEASIVLLVETIDNKLRILIENTSNEVKFSNGKIVTKKSDKKNHGKGLENIKKCLKMYNGTMKINYDDGVFVFESILNNKKSVVYDKKVPFTTKSFTVG